MSALLQKAKAACSAVHAAEAVVTAEVQKRAEIMKEGQAIDEELSRLVPAEESDAARRIVDGEDAAPAKPKRVSRITNLRERRPQITAALTLQDRRIEKARADIPPLMPDLCRAALELSAEMRGDAISEIRKALSDLSEPAARLIASDQVLAGLLGTSGFQVPTGAPLPIKGAVLMGALLKGIPETIRPTALFPTELAAAARSISQPILNEVKGTSTHV